MWWLNSTLFKRWEESSRWRKKNYISEMKIQMVYTTHIHKYRPLFSFVVNFRCRFKLEIDGGGRGGHDQLPMSVSSGEDAHTWNESFLYVVGNRSEGGSKEKRLLAILTMMSNWPRRTRERNSVGCTWNDVTLGETFSKERKTHRLSGYNI